MSAMGAPTPGISRSRSSGRFGRGAWSGRVDFRLRGYTPARDRDCHRAGPCAGRIRAGAWQPRTRREALFNPRCYFLIKRRQRLWSRSALANVPARNLGRVSDVKIADSKRTRAADGTVFERHRDDERPFAARPEVYYAENQIVKLIDKSANRDLTKGLGDHLQETRYQISRLDQVLMKLGREAQGVQCPAMT
jgi:hypothetical protein